MSSTIKYYSFPRTEPPPTFVDKVVEVFRIHELQFATEIRTEHLRSDDVLAIVATDLVHLGFNVENSKRACDKLRRPVFFGENGEPTLQYEVDAYHSAWRCGLEVEATRAIRGGALYRDLIQAMVMVQVDHLIIAVPNIVRWGKAGKSRSYAEGLRTADALFGHSRVKIPYGLTLIGY